MDEPENVAAGRASQRPQHLPDEATVAAAIALFGGAGLLLIALAVIWAIKAIASVFQACAETGSEWDSDSCDCARDRLSGVDDAVRSRGRVAL